MSGDVTHCPGGDCPWRHRCRRHTAEVLGRTDFFAQPPWRGDDGACDHYDADLVVVQRIRERAYRKWLDDGRPDGQALAHWLRADDDEAASHADADNAR